MQKPDAERAASIFDARAAAQADAAEEGQFAPRRDNMSEGLSMAMAHHREQVEAWHTVMMRISEHQMATMAQLAIADMRREYASISAEEALARAEATQTRMLLEKNSAGINASKEDGE